MHKPKDDVLVRVPFGFIDLLKTRNIDFAKDITNQKLSAGIYYLKTRIKLYKKNILELNLNSRYLMNINSAESYMDKLISSYGSGENAPMFLSTDGYLCIGPVYVLDCTSICICTLAYIQQYSNTQSYDTVRYMYDILKESMKGLGLCALSRHCYKYTYRYLHIAQIVERIYKNQITKYKRISKRSKLYRDFVNNKVLEIKNSDKPSIYLTSFTYKKKKPVHKEWRYKSCPCMRIRYR